MVSLARSWLWGGARWDKQGKESKGVEERRMMKGVMFGGWRDCLMLW